jgi:hypothetical protein
VTGNREIHYSGTFTGSQFGGDRSKFTQNSTTTSDADTAARLQELRSLITELLALIAAHADEIDHPERARRDAEEIMIEVARPAGTRDGGRVAHAFERLGARLGPIAGFTESIGKIAEFLGKIIAW